MSTALVLAIAFDLGLRQSGAWLIGQEPAADPAVATHLMALWLVLGAAGVLACWLMLEAGGYVAGYGALALVAALNVAPMLCLRTGQGVFLGRGDLGRLNRSELISRAVVLAGTIGLWALGLLDLAAAIWVLLAAHVAAAVYLLWQVSGAIRPATLFQPALVARMFRYGGELWVAMLLLILLGRIGFWIVSWQLGEDALGLYFGSQRLGEILVEVATAVGIVIFSYGVRATDIKASALDAIRIARLVTALMALVAAGRHGCWPGRCWAWSSAPTTPPSPARSAWSCSARSRIPTPPCSTPASPRRASPAGASPPSRPAVPWRPWPSGC